MSGPTDPPHRVSGLPGEPASVTLAYALGRLRALGTTGLRLVLTRPGDVSGLPGPPDFNQAAVDAGSAVLALGAPVGLLLRARGTWAAYPVELDRRTPMSMRDADRHLTSTIREAATALDTLEVARWDPSAALLITTGPRPSQLPSGAPAEAHELLARAWRLLAITTLAAGSDGAALQSSVMTARRQALGEVAYAARRAVEAACSAHTSDGSRSGHSDR